MIQAYTPSGQTKTLHGFCSTCRNGNAWVEDEHIRTGIYGPEYSEYICSVCNTKYRFKNVDKFEPLDLTKENQEKVMNQIFFNKEVDKMSTAFLEAKNFYDSFGTCLNHVWINSHPFKTAEGKFTIKSCRVCGDAEVVYKGEKVTGKLIDLVRMIANNGLKSAEKQEIVNKLDELIDLGIERKVPDLDLNLELNPTPKLDIPLLVSNLNLL